MESDDELELYAGDSEFVFNDEDASSSPPCRPGNPMYHQMLSQEYDMRSLAVANQHRVVAGNGYSGRQSDTDSISEGGINSDSGLISEDDDGHSVIGSRISVNMKMNFMTLEDPPQKETPHNGNGCNFEGINGRQHTTAIDSGSGSSSYASRKRRSYSRKAMVMLGKKSRGELDTAPVGALKYPWS